MSEVEFDRIIEAVRHEIALAPTQVSFAGLRASDERSNTADDNRRLRRAAKAPMVRVRRLGERQKRYR